MRKLMFHGGIFVILTSVVAPAAHASNWNGSYAADGQCFCSGQQGRDIDSTIVPTPVGGQTVAQICARIGSGPTLKRLDGKFNFTVYPDAQCGHGLPGENRTSVDTSCVGFKGTAGEDCRGPGARWNLTSAYAKKEQSPEPATENTAVATGAARYIVPRKRNESENKTVQSSKPVSNKPLAKSKKVVAQTAPVATTPLSQEEIRARQLKHLQAARERAASNNAEQTTEIVYETVEAPIVGPEKTESGAALADEQSQKALEVVVESAPGDTVANPLLTALKLPAAVRGSSREFNYVAVAPVSYDFGGSGMSVEASASSHDRMQYEMKSSFAESYQESQFGFGFYLTPSSADRVTVLLNSGIEHGRFEFNAPGVTTDLTDTGAYLRLTSRLVVNNRFELQAGAGYSSFFSGDASAYGAALFHMTRQLDFTAKAEVGDNDSVAFGIRYYY